jgi:hypothetical protein
MGGRVLRVITRLTVSGPSTHVLLLDRSQGAGYALVYGSVEDSGTEMDHRRSTSRRATSRPSAARSPGGRRPGRGLAGRLMRSYRLTSSTRTSRRPGCSAVSPRR